MHCFSENEGTWYSFDWGIFRASHPQNKKHIRKEYQIWHDDLTSSLHVKNQAQSETRFRELGHNAWSCDLQPCDPASKYSGFHLQGNAITGGVSTVDVRATADDSPRGLVGFDDRASARAPT